MPLIKGKSQKSFVKNMKTEMEHGKPQKQSLAIAYAMKKKAKKMASGGKIKGYADGDTVDPLTSTQTSMRQSFKTPASSSSSTASNSPSPSPSPSPSSNWSEADRAKASQDYNKKIYGEYAKGGEVYKPAHLLEQMHVDKHDDIFTGDGYRLRPMMMDKTHIAENPAAMHEDSMGFNQHHPDMQASTSMHEEDLVDRIMKKLSQDFSSEARLANGGYLEGKEMYPHAKGKMFDVTNHYSEGGKVANDTGTGQESDHCPNQFDDLVLRDDLESSYGEDDNAGDSLDNAQENKDRSDIVARIMASRKKKDKNPRPA